MSPGIAFAWPPSLSIIIPVSKTTSRSRSFNITAAPAAATAERSDVTAVPAMGVIAEAMAALVLANAFVEKFGGDSLSELRRNHDAYLSHIATRLQG